jgi:hypothetical protein
MWPCGTGPGGGGGGRGGGGADREETKEEYDARLKSQKKEERNALLRKFKQKQAIGDFNLDDRHGSRPTHLNLTSCCT